MSTYLWKATVPALARIVEATGMTWGMTVAAPVAVFPVKKTGLDHPARGEDRMGNASAA